MKKKANVPIGNFRWLKPSAHVPENSVMPVSKKLRLNDIFKWKGSYVRVDFMIENHPLELWNMVYNPKKGQKSISLENRAYNNLKNKVIKLKPDWIEEVNKKRQMIKLKRKLYKLTLDKL